MRLARRLRQQRPLGEIGLTGLSVLGRIDRDGACTATALAAAERIQPQSLTRLLADLQRRGLITRTPDPTDRRQNRIGLTAAARALLADDRRGRDRWLAEAMSARLTARQRAQLTAALPLLDQLAGHEEAP